MPASTAPQIIISGKKYTMPKPKIRLWRCMIKFTEAQQKGELEGENVLDEMTNLVVIAFNSPEITKETVEENVDLDELIDIFKYIGEQVSSIYAKKAAQFPNVTTPAGI